jgi:hypothetical protein
MPKPWPPRWTGVPCATIRTMAHRLSAGIWLGWSNLALAVLAVLAPTAPCAGAAG